MRLIELFEAIVYPKLDYLDNVKWDDERYKDIFTRSEYKHDAKGERVLIPFKSEENDSYNNIKKALKEQLPKNYKLTFTFYHYLKGYFYFEFFNDHPKAPKHEWKMQQKDVVKFLTHPKQGKYQESDDIIKKFVNDPVRHKSTKKENTFDNQYLAIISRNPNDIERMTQDRDWEFDSCMNLRNDPNIEPDSDEVAVYLWGDWGESEDSEVADWLWAYGEPSDDDMKKLLWPNGMPDHADIWDDETFKDNMPISNLKSLIESCNDFEEWIEGPESTIELLRMNYNYSKLIPIDYDGNILSEYNIAVEIYDNIIEELITICKDEYMEIEIDSNRNEYEDQRVRDYIANEYNAADFHDDGDSYYGYKYIPMDIEHGTVIAYCTSLNDIDIEDPIGRILIKPFVSKNKKHENLVHFGIERAVYGKAVPNFVETVKEWVDSVNNRDELNEVIPVHLHPELYDDGIKKVHIKFPANFDSEEKEIFEKVYHDPKLLKDLENKLSPENKEKLRMLLIDQDPKNIEFMSNPSKKVQSLALNSVTGVQSMSIILRRIDNIDGKIQMDVIKKYPELITSSHIRPKLTLNTMRYADQLLMKKINAADETELSYMIRFKMFNGIQEKYQWMIAKKYPKLMIKLSNDNNHVFSDKVRQYAYSYELRQELPNIPSDLTPEEIDVFVSIISNTYVTAIINDKVKDIRPEYQDIFYKEVITKKPDIITRISNPSETIQKFALDIQPIFILIREYSEIFSNKMKKYGEDLIIKDIQNRDRDALTTIVVNATINVIPDRIQKAIIQRNPKVALQYKHYDKFSPENIQYAQKLINQDK